MAHVVVGRKIVPSHAVIEDAHEQAYLRTRLFTLCGQAPHASHKTRGLPGCNPRSVSRHSMEVLTRRNYNICLKSDGVRYILLLTMKENGTTGTAIMIDRAQCMYEVEVIAPEDFFLRGTVLEGELVWRQPDRNELVFLVFDAICIKGECLVKTPFRERLQRATRTVCFSEDLHDADDLEARVLELDAVVLAQYDPKLVMRPKHFVQRTHAERLWAERTDTDHRVDGIILQDADAPYTVFGTGRYDSILKWKEHATVDLHTAAGTRPCTDKGEVPHTVGARTVDFKESRIEAEPAGGVFEYSVRVTAKTVELMAIRKREDKLTPNTEYVFLETVKDMADNMTPQDIATA